MTDTIDNVPDEYDSPEHHDGDGEEEELYSIGHCSLRVETAGAKIAIEAPDTIALAEIVTMAIEMAKELQTGVQ